MSTKIKNTSGRTVTQKTQGKPRVTSDRKPEGVRNAKETSDEKRSRTEAKNIKSITSKEDKEKAKITKQAPNKPSQSVRKPLVAKASSISSDTNRLSQTSKRVVKTQFFPVKNNYAEMLKHLNQYDMGSGDGSRRGKTKTALNRESSSESISTFERPRTSTLRKGSIVNENIAGPEAPKKVPPPVEPVNVTEDDEYEDDFDSYESDFENVSSSESTIHNLSEISTESTSSSSSDEDPSSKGTPSSTKYLERKLDSGNFDLKEDKQKREFSNLQDLMEKENSRLNRPESNIRSNMTSLSDEGFEEAKSLQFLNFVSAKKRNDRRRSMEMRKKRGEELLGMIKMDCVNFTVLDMPPVPYEDFIKTFGNVNSMQIGVQTGEENIDEEAQTEFIETQEKWTQMPPNISKDSLSHKFDRLGVGPSLLVQKIEDHSQIQFNEYKLKKFLSNTGGLVLDILKERKLQPNGSKSTNSFSDAMVTFRPPSEFSGKKRVTMLISNQKTPSVFLSVHVDDGADDFSKSMIYLWNVNEVSPEFYLACHGKIRSCCFGNDARTVFGGLHNGSLVLWETSDNERKAENICSMIEGDVYLHCPTFMTEIERSHCSPVVDIQCISESNNSLLFEDTESTLKICSLDQDGTVVVWNVISKQNVSRYGRWEKTTLMRNFEIDLRKLLLDMDDLLCNAMFVPPADSRFVLIATNYGSVLQCELNKEKPQVKVHSPGINTSPVKCLVACPFSDAFFLAGLDNGSVILYSRKSTKPLMVITNKDNKGLDESIEDIQWSLERPCMFYTRNSANWIDAWDLSQSNVFPVESLRMEEAMSCLRLSKGRKKKSYMIISAGGNIHLYFFNSMHRKENDEQYSREMNTFLTYVSRL